MDAPSYRQPASARSGSLGLLWRAIFLQVRTSRLHTRPHNSHSALGDIMSPASDAPHRSPRPILDMYGVQKIDRHQDKARTSIWS